MGCLRLVGSLKLQVSTAKKPKKRDYVLQKRPTMFTDASMDWLMNTAYYGVALASGIDKIIGLFCKRAL